jgi:signal transduction histidine kinase
MDDREWLVVIGPDGRVIATSGGVPSHWLDARLSELADVPDAVRTTARTLAANVCDPWRGTTVERARLVPPASGEVAVEIVAIEAVAMRRAHVALEPLLADTLATLRHQAEAMEIDVVIAQSPDVPARVAVDPEKIAWAVSALVGNSLRYVRRGTRSLPGGSIRVHLGYDNAAGMLTITVQDDGPGIPADKLPWLFARKPGTQRAAGVGLMLVRDVVAAHGGTVTVESHTDAVDHGTAVTLRLPAR